MEHTAKEITGQIDRVTFYNEENGYGVLKLQVNGYTEPVTAVGIFPKPAVGEVLRLTGSWIVHQRFGEQFKAESCETVTPSTVGGIEKFLSSGLIKGIGPVAAAKIVQKFGEYTLRVLDEESYRLLEVSGIGPKTIEMIKASWCEQKEIREVIVFLQSYGVSTGYAIRAWKQYGAMTLQVLRENPYRLAIDIFGIGFLTADKIATSLGFASDSPVRVRAGILHVLNSFVGEGSVYVPVDELTKAAAELLGVSAELAEAGIEQARLAAEIVVEWYKNDKGEDDMAVYLPAFQYAEEHSAKKLLELVSNPYNRQYVDVDSAVAWAENELGIKFADAQRETVRAAVNSQVMVITGGPGTGKTTLIRAILKLREANGYTVMLAAPTGRAAKRMSEATGHEAKTIHRLLEYVAAGSENGDFLRDENNPLECDLLIVDEASMIDQILFYHLLQALPLKASLILVGDVNQLPSVGAGNVLADVIESGVCHVSVLGEIFRQSQESRIIVNAHRINNGEMPLVDDNYASGLKDFYIIQQDDPDKALETIRTLVTEKIPQRFKFNPLTDIQVLTPMHRGSAGTIKLNEELQKLLNKTGGASVQKMGRTFREGDKVMQLRNNYDKDVYNGDIGIVYNIDGEREQVVVKMDNGLVAYEFGELDELVHAYAVSIHKSQGSEYPAVIIPFLTQHYVMLQRNLLYTAVTRGKQLVIIVGSWKAISIAVNNDNTGKRWTRLAERLKRGA